MVPIPTKIKCGRTLFKWPRSKERSKEEAVPAKEELHVEQKMFAERREEQNKASKI